MVTEWGTAQGRRYIGKKRRLLQDRKRSWERKKGHPAREVRSVGWKNWVSDSRKRGHSGVVKGRM